MSPKCFFPSHIFGYNVVNISNAYINCVRRLCWIAATLACAVLGIVFINSAWDNFSKVPIIVNVETTNYPLYKLPFPAITICPAVNVKRTIGENLLERYCLIHLITHLSCHKIIGIVCLRISTVAGCHSSLAQQMKLNEDERK